MLALIAKDARQHTALPFWDWHDDDVPDAALALAVQDLQPKPRSIAIDEMMRADHTLLVLDAVPHTKRKF